MTVEKLRLPGRLIKLQSYSLCSKKYSKIQEHMDQAHKDEPDVKKIHLRTDATKKETAEPTEVQEGQQTQCRYCETGPWRVISHMPPINIY